MVYIETVVSDWAGTSWQHGHPSGWGGRFSRGHTVKKANQHEHVKSQKHKKALQNTTPITITMTNSNNNTIIF
jgi:hypothetical protein